MRTLELLENLEADATTPRDRVRVGGVKEPAPEASVARHSMIRDHPVPERVDAGAHLALQYLFCAFRTAARET